MPAVGYIVKAEVKDRQRLEVFDEALRVVVKDHASVEQILRIEYLLQLFHGGIRGLAPLVFHKRCHVAPGAMLCLQRSVELFNHQPGNVAHHAFVSLHLCLCVKTLVEDEVVVALEGVSVDARVTVAIIRNQLLELNGSHGQVL